MRRRSRERQSEAVHANSTREITRSASYSGPSHARTLQLLRLWCRIGGSKTTFDGKQTGILKTMRSAVASLLSSLPFCAIAAYGCIDESTSARSEAWT